MMFFSIFRKAIAMADGDGAATRRREVAQDSGRAAKTIIEVRHGDSIQLVRLAWHLGNRHLPTEIRDEAFFASGLTM